MKFIVSNYLKASAPSEEFGSMTFAELLKETGATAFVPQIRGGFGPRLHLYKGDVKNAANRLFAVALGESVKTINEINTPEGFRELIQNHVVYYGTATKDKQGVAHEPRNWVSFGKAASLGEQVVFTTTDVEAMVKASAGAA